MKRWIWIVVAVVVVVALGTASYVYAQSGTNPWGQQPGCQMADGTTRGGRMMQGGENPLAERMQTAVVEAFSTRLGISADELVKKLENGETMRSIAEENGISQEEFIQIMKDTRVQVLDQAVADGIITAEQADWMKTRMENQFSGNCQENGMGTRQGLRGMRGHRNGFNGSCGLGSN